MFIDIYKDSASGRAQLSDFLGCVLRRYHLPEGYVQRDHSVFASDGYPVFFEAKGNDVVMINYRKGTAIILCPFRKTREKG